MRKFLLTLCLVLLAAQASAQPIPQGEVTKGASGLDIPRFVSISADRANLRSGPGEQYPILWVYTRNRYPMEIIGEYESWRKVRDMDGTEGWMHVVLLSGKRTVIVTGIEPETLYREPDTLARPVARAEPGVIGDVLECRPDWCRIDIGPEDGWIMTQDLWGTYEGETIK